LGVSEAGGVQLVKDEKWGVSAKLPGVHGIAQIVGSEEGVERRIKTPREKKTKINNAGTERRKLPKRRIALTIATQGEKQKNAKKR